MDGLREGGDCQPPGAQGYDLGGADAAVAGTVPMVAGLSSSAAFEVSVAGAMAAPDDLSFDHEPVSLCWEAETEFVGVDCGIVAQYASVQTEPESALFPDCRSETHEDVPLPTGELGVVATDTTVCRGLIDSADDDRVATRREGVEYFDDALDVDVDSLRDVDVASFDAHEPDLPGTVRKRVRHVVTENARVREAASALESGDVEQETTEGVPMLP